jgi:nucleotide-binding universal stress UspA family protein
MTRTILTAIDLTAEASWKHALPKAIELAGFYKAALHVVYVLPDAASALVAEYFPPDFRKKAVTQAEADLEALAAAQIPADMPVKLHLRHGEVHTEVLSVIEECGADLVVMASHAPDRIREFLVGSQADRVVRRSPVSVLVVRDHG